MRRGDDYAEMAQLAIEQGLPSEAQAALESGFARKVFTEQRDIDRNTRLLNAAKTKAATEKAGLAQADRAAAAGAKGDADVLVGESYLGAGQYAQAVTAIKRGLAKGNVANAAAAQTTLGIALLKSGAKADAANTFKAREEKVPAGWVRIMDFSLEASMSHVAVRARVARSNLKPRYFKTARGISGLHLNAYYRKADLLRVLPKAP